MRWLVRRRCFYVFALWVAVTLNFLLPRLMPGDPAGGMLARLDPAQIQSNPGIIETYRRMLGGGRRVAARARTSPTWARSPRSTSASRPRTTRPNVSEVIGRTLPYSIFLVGIAFILAFVVGTTIGMIAAWRRGGAVDNVVVPDDAVAERVPRLLHLARRRLLLRPQARLVPDPARVRHRARRPASTARSCRARSATRSCRSS